LDVVVNNAGYAVSGVVEGVSDEEARKQIEVNFWAPVKISREAVRWFRENNPPRQGGRVLNISSCGGFISNPTLAYYSASKFALEGFSEGLNKEMDPSWNIKVVAIQPGGVRTRWANGNMLDLPFPPAYADPAALPTRFREMTKTKVPMNDPNKVGKALIAISKEANPPLRLPLGADSRYVIQGKIAAIQKELEEWKELEVSVVADDADPHFFEKLSGIVM
ncbi:NAD-P-binding protein, partial [Polyporus arcularius HHB13444]